MNRRFVVVVISFVLVFLGVVVFAEDKVVVDLSNSEIAFSLNLMNSIELAGGEVGPFLDIKNLITSAYKDVSSKKKKSMDVEFTVPMAKNFLFFMQRAKLRGEDATTFNDLSKKMVDCIKKVSKK